ncbi:MAG TPA: hypothetical protein VJH67_03535 [Candidatus Paceibacterota bacterium]
MHTAFSTFEPVTAGTSKNGIELRAVTTEDITTKISARGIIRRRG